MRISSLFLTSLFVFNFFSISAHSTTPKGYVKDSQGRTLVYRTQQSLWLIPGGLFLGGVGACAMLDARDNVDGKMKLGFPFNLRDLHDQLPNIRLYIPITLSAPFARVIKGAVGVGFAASGASILGAWIYNYTKLSTPLMAIDKQGFRYDGRDMVYWKDVKSVRIVHDTAFNWNNGTGSRTKEEYALEIVDAHDRLLIHESDIAVSVETLDELIKQYFRKYW